MMTIFDEAMIEAEEWRDEIRSSGHDSEILVVRDGKENFDFEIHILEDGRPHVIITRGKEPPPPPPPKPPRDKYGRLARDQYGE